MVDAATDVTHQRMSTTVSEDKVGFTYGRLLKMSIAH